jgi:hypothetical protein
VSTFDAKPYWVILIGIFDLFWVAFVSIHLNSLHEKINYLENLKPKNYILQMQVENQKFDNFEKKVKLCDLHCQGNMGSFSEVQNSCTCVGSFDVDTE